jgi:hypothetical protein
VRENRMCYEELPEGMDFSTEFETFILAFCPDTDSWFATNKRFFYYEYPKDFPDEESAIEFFKNNPKVFYEEEARMQVYKPDFYLGKVRLENTDELIDV